MQVLHLYVNRDTQQIINSDGTFNANIPRLFANSYVTIYFHVVDSNNNPVSCSGATWLFGLDNSYADGHTDLLRVDNTKFNLDLLAANVAAGELTCLIEPDGGSLRTAIGNTNKLPAYAYLWGDLEGVFLLAQWDMNICATMTTMHTFLKKVVSATSPVDCNDNYYDTGTTLNGQIVYRSSNGLYYLFYSHGVGPDYYWCIWNEAADILSPYFYKVASPSVINGVYAASVGTGTPTVSDY